MSAYNFGPDREDVYSALWGLASGFISAGAATDAQPFINGGRKLRSFPTVPADMCPALFQVEPTEITMQRTRMPSKRIWKAFWVVYTRSDPVDLSDIGATQINQLVGLLENALVDQGPESVQTLGDLVAHCFISGETFKNPGDTQGVGIISIPLSILIP